MPNRSVPMEFDAYLRLSSASSMEWSAAFCRLSGCDQVKCTPEKAASPVGSLSALALEQGGMCYFSVNQAIRMSELVCPSGSVIMVRRGEVFLTAVDARVGSDELFYIPGDVGSDMTVSEGARVFIVKWHGRAGVPSIPGPFRIRRPEVRALLQDFLERSRFFRDHDHSVASATSLLTSLARILNNEDPEPEQPPPLLQDKRVQRAVEHIECNRRWSFSLPELAGIAGVSERNLYYLMRRETGLTPYRYYQRCRLLRVRLRLVDCRSEEPHISWYASDEGFSHLGRFAGLYREHFGELPSETVQWRTSLTESLAELAE